MDNSLTRRDFFRGAVVGAGAVAMLPQVTKAAGKTMQGFDETDPGKIKNTLWKPVSDRKIKVGIVGYGNSRFGAQFGFQNHPNVEVLAAADLFSDRCAELAKQVGAKKTYASCEEMYEKDKEIEAVFIATNAPSHAQLCIAGLNRGLHVCSAVPAVFGEDQLEYADELLETVKKTGMIYSMFETTAFRAQCYAMREIYKAGGFGKLIYTEGEYYHYMGKPINSYKGWRDGLVPQYYPTHSNGFYTCVTGGSFTEVSCMGMPSIIPHLQPGNNPYKNPYGSEIALFRTSEGGMARMAVCWDMPGAHGEKGRVYGQKGSYGSRYSGRANVSKVGQAKPKLPPGMPAGAHGGSHGYLTEDFITSILLKRKPVCDVACALNTTVAGIIAHQSAMKGGETMKIPQYKL
ncbi:MAG: Gfo/Idh/MocA family oxidoreductase [Kiritimatiellae bacterium]|jgi:predicted dehydrogenase|nr:Gfo/Idh/MocA family oxidoreductase [Kiritimatiellia bacterium]